MKKMYPESVDAEQEFGPIPGPGGGPRWESTPLRMAYTPYYVPISINVPCIQAWYDEINEIEQNAYWPLARDLRLWHEKDSEMLAVCCSDSNLCMGGICIRFSQNPSLLQLENVLFAMGRE